MGKALGAGRKKGFGIKKVDPAKLSRKQRLRFIEENVYGVSEPNNQNPNPKMYRPLTDPLPSNLKFKLPNNIFQNAHRARHKK